MKKLKHLCKQPGCTTPATIQCICGEVQFCSHHGMEYLREKYPDIVKKLEDIDNE